MNHIRVLLAEDHTIVRKGLRSLLAAEEDLEIVGEAENGREAVEKVDALAPDIVLMDISMPGLNGLEATRHIKKHAPKIKILILTMHTDEEYVFQILQAGASGYLLKQSAIEELVSAIRVVWRGESYLSPSISKTVIDGYLKHAGPAKTDETYSVLTGREGEILQLLAEGSSTREIAATLCISVKTVETHRSHIMEKLNLHNTAELVKYAIRKGIISTE